MDGNIDVLETIKQKNKEIYINKLGIDLDKVLETLLMTINNSLSFLAVEVVNQLPELRSERKKSDVNGKSVIAFYRLLKEKLIISIKDSFESLFLKIQDIDLVNYNDLVDEHKKKIIDEINKLYLEKVSEVINKLLMEDKTLDSERVNNYFNDYAYQRLITKISGVLTDSFNILCNSHEESFQKFESLNDKTLNSQNSKK